MKANDKSTKDASRQAPEEIRTPGATMTNLGMLMQRNLARLVGLQKTTLDTLGEQSADVAEAMRNGMKSNSFASNALILDLAEHAMQTWIGVQKEFLDMTGQQSEHAVETLRERGASVSQWTEEVTDFAQQTAERAITAQKKILDFAAAQNKAFAEAVRRQPGLKDSPVSEVTDSVERRFDRFIGMQKDFLDSANKMGRNAADRS